MKKFILTEDLLMAIAKYLQVRPYQEVAGLIQALQQVETYEKPETKE